MPSITLLTNYVVRHARVHGAKLQTFYELTKSAVIIFFFLLNMCEICVKYGHAENRDTQKTTKDKAGV